MTASRVGPHPSARQPLSSNRYLGTDAPSRRTSVPVEGAHIAALHNLRCPLMNGTSVIGQVRENVAPLPWFIPRVEAQAPGLVRVPTPSRRGDRTDPSAT